MEQCGAQATSTAKLADLCSPNYSSHCDATFTTVTNYSIPAPVTLGNILFMGKCGKMNPTQVDKTNQLEIKACETHDLRNDLIGAFDCHSDSCNIDPCGGCEYIHLIGKSIKIHTSEYITPSKFSY